MKRIVLVALFATAVFASTSDTASAQLFWGRRAVVVPAPIVPAGPGLVVGPLGRVRLAPPVLPYGPVPPVAVVPAPVVPVPAVPVPADPVPTESVAIDVPRASVQFGPWGVEVRAPGFSYRADAGVVAASPGSVSVQKPAVGLSTEWVADLLEASHRLSASLSRHPQGEVWIEYLKPVRIAELVQPWQSRSDAGMSAEATQELKSLSSAFEGVVANRQLGWLRGVDGFEDTRVLLSMVGDIDAAATNGSASSAATGPTPAPQVAPEGELEAGPSPDGAGNSILAPPTEDEVTPENETAPSAPDAETLPAPVAESAPERIEI